MQKKNLKNRQTANMEHLSDEEIAFCTQELILERYADSVPDHIQLHLGSCHTCFSTVQDFYKLICDESGLIKSIRSEEHAQNTVQEATSETGRLSIPLQNSVFRWLSVAAAILVLATGAFFLFTQSGPDPQALFAQYYKPYHDVVTSKSTQDNHYLMNGLFYYNIGEYNEAITYFNNGLTHHPNDYDLLFYLAGSYLATGDHENATAIYERLQTTSLVYQSPARWYLALSYLAGNKTAEAVAMLERISDAGGFYAADANEVLQKLNRKRNH